MIRPAISIRHFLCLCALLGGIWARPADAQFTITAPADRSTATDSATFTVATNAGYTYEVTLNGKPVAAGVTHTVRVMDYYDLAVRAVQTSDGAVTTALRRFIVLSSNRGSPERGLIEWVPLPPIPSTSAEMAGAQLNLMVPSMYPAGLEIPVVARVEEESGKARRVNGWVTAPGYAGSEFRMLRGIGHGFLPRATAGTLSYTGQLGSLQAEKVVTIEPSTTWTTVSGVLGTTTWAPNSRIHVTGHLTVPAGSTLTIGAGTVVRLSSGVNITNSGRTVINGTLTEPVVFTPTNRVAPEQNSGAWGGWLMRGASSELTANCAIMTGSGAASSFTFTPSTSHRSEQPLFLLHSGAILRMTNCAMINQAGQIGNGYFSTITWDRCVIQRAVTVGEYEGCTNIINASALIEFPSVDGIYNSAIADADYDGFYTIRGTNYVANSLFGFAKDDAMDFGSGGPGSAVVTNCWVESALHEALAWSGEGRRTWTYDSVLINCGQGLECGWSTGADSPLVYGIRILSTANSVGTRYGDNYEGTTGLGLKTGFLTVSNSLFLHNYRDVWGQVWDDTWNYRVARMDIHDNWLTAPNTNHPNNTVWNPAVDGPKLAAFMTTPPDAPVGMGIALWPNQLVPSMLTNGVPVRLSSFTPNPVSVNYSIATGAGTLDEGILVFSPGETVKRITLPPASIQGLELVQIKLESPVGAELTGDAATYLAAPTAVVGQSTTLISSNAVWRFSDTNGNLGTAWRALNYPDSGWASGGAELGFGDGGEITLVNGGPATTRTPTIYFRHKFNVTDTSTFGNLFLGVLRDDGAIAYLNDQEVYRGNVPNGTVSYGTYTGTSTTSETQYFPTNVNPSRLVVGMNIMAVEVHQAAIDSSDLSFNLLLVGQPSPTLQAARFEEDLVLYWNDPSFTLESTSSLPGGWQPVPGGTSPFVVVPTESQKYYRLKR